MFRKSVWSLLALLLSFTYLYPYLDEKTRTNKVRLELANRGGRESSSGPSPKWRWMTSK